MQPFMVSILCSMNTVEKKKKKNSQKILEKLFQCRFISYLMSHLCDLCADVTVIKLIMLNSNIRIISMLHVVERKNQCLFVLITLTILSVVRYR